MNNTAYCRVQFTGFLLVIVCVLGLFFIGCSDDISTKREQDIEVIKEFLESSGNAVNAGDVEAEVNRFTEDGIYMWPDAPAIRGHEALREWFRQRFARVDVKIKNVSEELEICGEWAFERGSYVARIHPKDGDSVKTIRGKYINILKKLPDGSWRISLRIRNRDHPAVIP